MGKPLSALKNSGRQHRQGRWLPTRPLIALIDATKRPFLPVLTHLTYIRSGHVHPLKPDSKPIPRRKAREISFFGAWGAVSTHDALRRDADGVEHYARVACLLAIMCNAMTPGDEVRLPEYPRLRIRVQPFDKGLELYQDEISASARGKSSSGLWSETLRSWPELLEEKSLLPWVLYMDLRPPSGGS